MDDEPYRAMPIEAGHMFYDIYFRHEFVASVEGVAQSSFASVPAAVAAE